MGGLLVGVFSFSIPFLRASAWHWETLWAPFCSLTWSSLCQAETKGPAPGPSKVSVPGLLAISPPASTLTLPLGVTDAGPGQALLVPGWGKTLCPWAQSICMKHAVGLLPHQHKQERWPQTPQQPGESSWCWSWSPTPQSSACAKRRNRRVEKKMCETRKGCHLSSRAYH